MAQSGPNAKPPYSVPSMKRINAIAPCGLRVASTFAGCGGSSLGYRMAGFRVLYANEFVPAARETYAANKRKWTVVDDRDVREVKPESILELAGVEKGELDVLDGSPPCSSFSMAGKRSAGWGEESTYSDTKQRTDDLFYEFARLVDGVRPRVFVAENVSGLVKGVSKGYFKRIVRALEDCGYRVGARLLDSQWLGVPQARQRVILIGVRDDLDRDPVFPTPMPYRYSIADALPGLAGLPVETVGRGRRRIDVDKPSPTVQQHGNLDTFSELSVAVTGRTGPGFKRVEHPLDEPIGTIQASDPLHTRWEIDADGLSIDPETGYVLTMDSHAICPEWDKLRQGESSERYFNLVRPNEDRPSPTIVQANNRRGVAGVTHPRDRRKFNLIELRRLCSFPDDFVLTGSYQQRWERLGRAVPPLMMRAIASTIRDEILCAP